jgi:hypothetical protein
VAVGEAHAQPLATRRAPVGAAHVGPRPGFVDEHQPIRIEAELTVEPRLAALQDVRAVPLCRVGDLFLRVILRRWKNRRSVP